MSLSSVADALVFLRDNAWATGFVLALCAAFGFAYRAGASSARNRQTEKDIVDEKAKREKAEHQYGEQKRINAELKAALDRLQETVTLDGYVFLYHDSKPHHPLCPSCRAKGATTRMIVVYNYSKPMFACPITDCKVRIGQSAESVKRYLYFDFPITGGIT